MRKSIIVLTLVAIPITAFVWSYAYMMAGDCPGLDGGALNACVSQKKTEFSNRTELTVKNVIRTFIQKGYNLTQNLKKQSCFAISGNVERP